MADTSADIIIRLIAKDEGVRKSLKAMGDDGEKALKKIDDASKKASPGLKRVDDVAAQLKEQLFGAGNAVGGLKSKLGLMVGVAGLAVGALTAIAVAARAAAAAGEGAAFSLAAVGDTAEGLTLSTDEYQALTFALSELRIEQGQVDRLLEDANARLAEATLGTGEFASKIKQLNPSLLDEVNALDNLEDKLAAIQRAYKSTTDETEKNILSQAIFGANMQSTGRKILGLDANIKDLTESAKKYGVVQDEDLIRKSQIAATEIERADARIAASKLRLQALFSDFAVSLKQQQADALSSVAAEFGGDELFKLEDRLRRAQSRLDFARSERTLSNEVPALERRIERLKTELAEFNTSLTQAVNLNGQIGPASDGAGAASFGPDPEKKIELEKALADLQRAAATAADRRTEALRQLDEIRSNGVLTDNAEFDRLRAAIIEKYKDVDAIRAQAKAAAEARKLVAQAERDERAAAQTRRYLGDITGVLAERETELNGLVERGALSRDEATRALDGYRDKLDGTASAQQQLASALEQTLDPVARFEAQTRALAEAQDLANIPVEDFNRLLAARAAALSDLQRSESDASERENFGETLNEAAKRIRQSLKSTAEIIDEKVALERKIVDALIASGGLTDALGAERLTKYREELTKSAEETDRLSRAQETLLDIIENGVRSWDDLFSTILSGLTDIIRESARAGGSLGDIFGSIGASLFGGGGQPTVNAGVAHSGRTSVGNTPGPTRRISASVFANAPRLHDGIGSLASDEYPFILQKNERVVSASDNQSLIAAINRTAAPAAAPASVMRVEVIDKVGARVSARRERDGVRGDKLVIDLDRKVRSAVQESLGNGSADGVMSQRFGINPVPSGRR